MKKEIKRKELLQKLSKIAFAKSNDAVKLAFIDPETGSNALDRLDLTALSELKRAPNGTVEIKLINRLELIKLLLGELAEPETAVSKAEQFLMAMNEAAKNSENAGDGR